jgi:hypothetical protein
LVADGIRDAVSMLSDMAGLLGIGNVLTSYEHLESGHPGRTEGWKSFGHIPEL